MVGCQPNANPCEAAAGLVTESREVMEGGFEPDVLDAGLVAGAQKIEHYEIGVYGTLCAWAKQLGRNDVAQILHQTLEEEKATDRLLTRIAERMVNREAAHA
mgnify:FL=1